MVDSTYIVRQWSATFLNIKALQGLHYNWPTFAINNPRSAFHNINAYTKCDENPLKLLKLSSRGIDKHTDDQRETIMPRHYCVAGYNKY